jgi:uncharacterized delta-60 repeat protein
LRTTNVAATLCALLVLCGPAAAAPAGGPVRTWSVSKIERGAGEVEVASGVQPAGALHEVVDIGPTAFNFGPVSNFPGAPYTSPVDGRASGDVSSSADGAHYSVASAAPVLNPFRANSAKGGVTHLDTYQTYEKRSADASLRITITDALMQLVDSNLNLSASECPGEVRCFPLRSIVRFHARAYSASAGAFFNVGGIAFLKGHTNAWDHWDATSADSQVPMWTSNSFLNFFLLTGPFGEPLVGAEMHLSPPRKLKVPLAPVRTGELFAVHVSLEAETVDDRGHESAAVAYIRDPQDRGPALLTAHGLKRRGKPRFKEPRVKSLRPARCPGGRPRGAGVLQLSDSAFSANESDRDPLVLVTRTGGARGSASVTLRTRGGSARAGADFRQTSTTVRFADGESTPRLVEIPLREDQAQESPEELTVSLSHLRCARLGAQRSAAVTILDDDQPPTTPGGSAPAFTIGGTVDGLQGSGLVLSNLGAELPVSANGSFTVPGTATDGQTYEVRVKTQPHSPDQVCSVERGAGHVSSANVTDIAVHCATIATPSGLDATFGSGGRVSTPGGGDGRAVLIQPDGRIVTVGQRGDGVHFEFGATRHDAAGNLDHSFGTEGIATTDLGGSDDEAFDAAPLADGGFVAVGRTDAKGQANTDFGVARYTADGQPVDDFDDDGFVTTDISGHGDQANAVAVQPDGKIVVAGFAQKNGVNGDFALVRYNPDGTLDKTFDVDGVVTTDLGTENDAARALAIQPDGRIVAVGENGEDVELARYLSDGTPDPTFAGDGSVVSNLGFDDVANGVAVTPSGNILVAGTRLGPKATLDLMVAGYGPDGVLNLGFGQLGVADADLSGKNDFGDDLVLDAGGNIVVVGSATSPTNPTVTDMALVRFTSGGTLDTSLTADFHGAGDFGHDLAIDSVGRIVAAGSASNGSENEFALMRATF